MDATTVFPMERQSTMSTEPNILIGNSDDIVKFTVEKADQQAVLFYGKSSEYSKSKS